MGYGLNVDYVIKFYGMWGLQIISVMFVMDYQVIFVLRLEKRFLIMLIVWKYYFYN